MEEIGHGGGRSRQAVHQLADILANKLVRALKPQLGKTTEEQGEAYRRDLRALYEKLRPWFESTP
jgi:ABC-type Zn uptake system ZnuABC Zn-binding protein ZnuA